MTPDNAGNSGPTRAVMAFILSLAMGALGGHIYYDTTAKAEFRERAQKKGYTEQQISEWLSTGYVTVDPVAKRQVGMGFPINYGNLPHIETLLYGTLAGLAFGGVAAVAIFVTSGRTGEAADAESERASPEAAG